MDSKTLTIREIRSLIHLSYLESVLIIWNQNQKAGSVYTERVRFLTWTLQLISIGHLAVSF